MPVFQIEAGGKVFEVDAPDQGAALAALSGVKAKPQPQPIAEGDWEGLAGRISEAEGNAKAGGPITPEMAANARQQAAREEGRIYGAARSAKGAKGLLGEGVGRAMDKFALGLPRLTEAYMPGFLGGQSALPGAEAHEFLKAADEGRATVNPGTAIAGNLAGALGQAVATPLTAATIPGRIAQGALASGIIGAGESAVQSRGDLGETASGAGTGALFGAGGGAIAEGAIRAGRAIVDPLRGVAKSGPADQQAIARIALEAQRAKLTPSQVTGQLQRLGPDAMMGDALGVQGASMARSAANLSPEARSLLETASQSRIANQPARLADDINRASGNPAGRTVQQLSEFIDDASRPAINRAYDTARAAGYDLPRSPFNDILSSPKVEAAVKQATNEIKDRVAAYGGDQASQLAIYDAAKKILDRLGWKEGDDLAKALAAKLRQTVDAHVPEYGGARALAANVKRAQEGLEVGTAAAKRAPGRDVADNIAEAINRGVPQGRVAQGYGAAKVDQLANKGPSEVNLKLSPAEEAAARAALGPNYSKIAEALERERTFMRFHKELVGNSSTARQIAQQMAGAGLATGSGTGAAYLSGFDLPTSASIGAALAAGKSGLKHISAVRNAKSEREVAERLAELLTSRVMHSPTRTMTARRAMAEELARTGARAGALQGNN